jgi:hypothetical protein
MDEGGVLQGRQVRGVANHPQDGVDDAGRAHGHRQNAPLINADLCREPALDAPELSQERGRVAVARRLLVRGQDAALQVGQRRARGAAAYVHADDEARLGVEVDEDGAPPALALGVAAFAHQPGPQQELHARRHGRLADAEPPRDLGARERPLVADELEDALSYVHARSLAARLR